MDSSYSFADQVLEKITRSLAGRSTRCSFLGKAAGLAFGILGIELLPVVPVARASPVKAAGWMLCGIDGMLCETDCGQADDFTCPANCNGKGGSWSGCCLAPMGGANVLIDYIDCFRQSGNLPNCPTQTRGNKRANCNVPAKKFYRDGVNGDYCCTILKNTGMACAMDP